jgi:metal-dependent HD superfamily phosphatase/phosphodiesterase
VPVVDEITIQRDTAPPVRVVLRLSRADELPAVEALLQSKLARVPFADLVQLVAHLEGEPAGAWQLIRVWNVEGERIYL